MDPEPKKILVVDDVRSIAHSLAGILQAEGFNVATALDGEDCLARVDEFRPHLIILDLLMPKMHGMDVLKNLRKNPAHAETGVIINSTKDFATEFRLAKELGAYGMICKPTSRRELLERVNGFFANEPAPEARSSGSQIVTNAPEYEPSLENTHGVLRFWGTRGSFPAIGPSFVRHGGHTTCMQFDSDEDVIIFDAGTGIREIGNKLAGGNPGHIHLFVTHTHWDHIQGFPSFAPIYQPGSKITVYGDKGFGESLESLITGQLSASYFPVHWDEIRADIRFEYLSDEPVTIGGVTVSRDFVNHPGATLAYKIQYRGRTTVFMPDNEFLQGYLGPPEKTELIHDHLVPYVKLIKFINGADVLIYEAQYLNPEYHSRIGWGHSSLSNACLLASLGRVKRWIITHHDPAHDDRVLDDKLALTRRVLDSLQCKTAVAHAYDGMAEWL